MSAHEPNRAMAPSCRAAEGEGWHHFLHGHVPGHEVDFVHRPEAPDRLLPRQGLSRLARLLKHIEPREGEDVAFAIGNLARDPLAREPALALVLGVRVRGAPYEAGRADPPFSHAVVAPDRALDRDALLDALIAFHARAQGGAATAACYCAFARAAGGPPEIVDRALADYLTRFADLPPPAPGSGHRPGLRAVEPPYAPGPMDLVWRAEGTPPDRMVFVHPDDTPFADLARAAARLAAILCRSDVRWTAIGSGRDPDLPGGLSIRFLPEGALGPADAAADLHVLGEIHDDDDALARELFGARPAPRGASAMLGWRLQRDAEPGTPESAPARSAPSVPAPIVPIPVPLPLVSPPPLEPARSSDPPPIAPRRARIALAAVCLAAGILVTHHLLRAKGAAAPRPPPPPPATLHVAAAAAEPLPTATERPVVLVSDPPAPPRAAPSASSSAAAKPAPPAPPTPRCRIVDGEPCF